MSYISVNTEIKEMVKKMIKNENKLTILVLGGNGFIGCQAVKALANKAKVIIGTRNVATTENTLTVHMQTMQNKGDWPDLLAGVDVVVNSVGILRERKNESYDQVHNVAVQSLAQACESLGISLIQISALGLSDQARSRFIQSKLAGERAIQASGVKATIVRPSLLDGEGGYGAKWFRMVAAWPVHLVMQSKGLVSPLQVSDLGEAIAALVLMPAEQRPAIVELGGNDITDIPNYLKALRCAQSKAPAMQISVPKVAVRMVSHIFDVLNWTPLSFGHYELMQGYNVPSKNVLPGLLGRQPSNTGECTGLIDIQNESMQPISKQKGAKLRLDRIDLPTTSI